jgi:hypothetical protein
MTVQASPRGRITTDGPWFKDRAGRTLLLRGVNLSGSSKVPYRPDGATHRHEGFYDHRDVSFVGRPFPLHEADEHLERLRSWGLTFLRLLVTWEAVEHAGPGQYDEEYLAYLRAVVERAGRYGIDVFVDPHQDAWSRWTGGDGAPGWTLEAVGFDLSRLAATGAAFTHQTVGDPFPRMIWSSNYARLGCATMFTLFLAGNDVAPRTTIEGVPVQDYLQGHFIAAMARVAQALEGLGNVAGYDTLNEPRAGYLGVPDLATLEGANARLRGPMPTPFQGMLLGSGHAQDVSVWDFGVDGYRQVGTQVLNADGVSVWRDGFHDLWRDHGVWEGTTLLKPDYFAHTADFTDGYLAPFVARFRRAIREVDPEALIFVEGAPGGRHVHLAPEDAAGIVNATHWYDVLALYTKTYRQDLTQDWETKQPIHGLAAVRRSYAAQLRALRDAGVTEMGGVPTLIGEFGLPFDLDDGAAYRTGDFSSQVSALDAYAAAMDANLLSFTLWNYTTDNSNEHGDKWCGEDLSLYSPDQRTDPGDVNSGGRALEGIVRPYALATAGTPLSMRFDLPSRRFELIFHADPAVQAPTEIFVPRLQYPGGYAVTLSAGTCEQADERQVLVVHGPREACDVSLSIAPPASLP